MTVATRMVLRMGIQKVGTQKEAARRINYSDEMLSKVLAGKRNLAPDVAPKLARMHPMIGQALATEVTGYRCFSYIDGDRHPQNMLRRVEKEDWEADEALKRLPWLLIDKRGPDDLTPEEKSIVQHAGQQICDRIRADLNFVVEMDDRYKLNLLDYLLEKEKAPMKAAR